MVCTWRPLVEKFCILLRQARVGRERKGRGNEKAAGGMIKALRMILHHSWLWKAL
jgi:hypothetical protein